jgi:hypothetical protein
MYYKESVPINNLGNKCDIEFSLASSINIDDNIHIENENT